MKLLTIIVPTYNMEKYLGRCLSSLIVGEDNINTVEILVVNDGSRDHSSEIAHSYETKYPGIVRVIDKPNGNYGSCVNVGLAEAKGKYIKLLDADDFFETGNFNEFLSFLRTVDVDAVLTDSVSVSPDGRVLGKTTYPLETDVPVGMEALLSSGIKRLNHHNLTYRTSLLREIGYEQREGISYTDLQWTFFPVSAVNTLVYHPAVVYQYLIGRENQTVNPEYRSKNMWMENEVVLSLADYYEKSCSRCDAAHNNFLFNLAADHVERVYYHYLINFPKQLDEKELESFDESLSDISQSLYKRVNSSEEVRRFGTFKYVSLFRERMTRDRLLFKLRDFISELSLKLKK